MQLSILRSAAIRPPQGRLGSVVALLPDRRGGNRQSSRANRESPDEARRRGRTTHSNHPKRANIAGLQLADVLAYPVKQMLLAQKSLIVDPGEVFGKKVYGAGLPKFNRNEETGVVDGYGTKWL